MWTEAGIAKVTKQGEDAITRERIRQDGGIARQEKANEGKVTGRSEQDRLIQVNNQRVRRR